MVVKFKGKIHYTSGALMKIDIDESGKTTATVTGDIGPEPLEHTRYIADVIDACYTLLKTCSPRKVEFEEV